MTYTIEIDRMHKFGDRGDCTVRINGVVVETYADKYKLVGDRWIPAISDAEIMRTAIMDYESDNGRNCRW